VHSGYEQKKWYIVVALVLFGQFFFVCSTSDASKPQQQNHPIKARIHNGYRDDARKAVILFLSYVLQSSATPKL